jgi:hypothetical protein
LLNTLESEDHAIEGSWELCDAIPGLIGPALPGIRVTAEVGDIFRRDKSDLVDADVPTVGYFGGGTIANPENEIDANFPSDVLVETLKGLVQYARFGWLILTFDIETLRLIESPVPLSLQVDVMRWWPVTEHTTAV